MPKRKRPVYIVVYPTGYFVGNDEAEILVGIRQTAVSADILKNANKGSIVKKSFLDG